jgi:Flp pilus assembly protein TadG
MIPILGFAAISVDLGSMYWEQAQLQNGADAAALGVAQLCADTGGACTGYDTQAKNLSSCNVNESRDLTQAVCAGPNGTPVRYAVTFPAAGTVTVQTQNPTDSTFVAHPFANAIGMGPNTVSTSATAIWGAPNTGTATIPIAISYCDWQKSTLDPSAALQFLQLNNPNSSPNSANCANASYPSGFGWLANSVCSTTITINQWNDAVPGKSYPGACDSTFTTSLLGQTVLVPIYNNYQAQGSNGQFYVFAFAAFQIDGWSFTGNNDQIPAGATCPQQGKSCSGIWGRFLNWVFTTGTPTPGTPNLGATVVQLTK